MEPDRARQEVEPSSPAAGSPVWAAVHEADLALADALERAGLTLTQLLVLRQVAQHGDGVPVRTLGELMQMSAPSISRLCQRLERASFLDRIGGPRRAVAVRATDDGRRALRSVDEFRASSWDGIMSTMGSSHRADLLHELGCESPSRPVAERDPQP